MKRLPPRAAEPAAQAPVPARWRPLVTWAGTILYMALLFWLSSRSGSDVSRWNVLRIPDFWLHTGAYLGLGIVAHWAFAATFRGSFAATACAAVLLAGLYGITDEYHQSMVPGRDPSWQDVAADFFGAALGQLVLWAWPAGESGVPGTDGTDRKGSGGERIVE